MKNTLEGAERTEFRRLAATLNDMSLDRSDVQHAAEEVCTKMATPTRRSWKHVEEKRVSIKEALKRSLG